MSETKKIRYTVSCPRHGFLFDGVDKQDTAYEVHERHIATGCPHASTVERPVTDEEEK